VTGVTGADDGRPHPDAACFGTGGCQPSEAIRSLEARRRGSSTGPLARLVFAVRLLPDVFPMHWIAPPEKDSLTGSLEKRLWDTADQFRANSGLKAQEYSGPILGIIFLRFAEVRFIAQRAILEKASAYTEGGVRIDPERTRLRLRGAGPVGAGILLC
jgi:hypothetical protein